MNQNERSFSNNSDGKIPTNTVFTEKANFRQDLPSIFLLLLLYVLQGIPLGVIETVPFLLQQRGVPYTAQAQFSLANLPYALKILQAPIVDVFYWRRFGRRKSWVIPLQYVIALFLIVLAFKIEALLDSCQVTVITTVFFILTFLCATQDVAVDGWGLTLLQPKNVGYASMCNHLGQDFGKVVGYSGFFTLNSVTFANYFRTSPVNRGLISLPEFLLFWAVLLVIVTTVIMMFKKEEPESESVTGQHLDFGASYLNLWKILRLRSIRPLIIFFLTVRIGMATTETMVSLKLVEHGVPKEWMAFFSVPLIPFKLILPIVISKYTVGSNPMGVVVNAVPFGNLFGLIFPVLMILTQKLVQEGGGLPSTYYCGLFVILAVQLVPLSAIGVGSGSFFAKISDPAIGGTYITLLNTVSNVGVQWAATFAMWLLDYVAIHVSSCDGFIHDAFSRRNFSITNDSQSVVTLHNSSIAVMATPSGDPCAVKIDGFYAESLLCVLIGFIWLAWGRPTILRLQRLPLETWRITRVTDNLNEVGV